MRFLFLLVLALFTGTRCAQADSIFAFSGTVGDIDVSGTLTTDGTVGVLTSAAIQDFTLTLTRGSSTVVSDATRHFDLTGSLLNATADTIFFDFGTGSTGDLLLFANDQTVNGFGANYLCLSGGPSYTCGGSNTNSIGLGIGGVSHSTDSFTMQHSVATLIAATPEPSSLALLATGMIASATVLRRRMRHRAE